jgi:hypothetical protein
MNEISEDRFRAVEMQITTHEAVCAERYIQINNNFSILNKIVQSAIVAVFVVGFALICGMTNILVKLTFHV